MTIKISIHPVLAAVLIIAALLIVPMRCSNPAISVDTEEYRWVAERSPMHFCPECRSYNTARFQWVESEAFEYWICWDCDRRFVVNNPISGKEPHVPTINVFSGLADSLDAPRGVPRGGLAVHVGTGLEVGTSALCFPRDPNKFVGRQEV